MKAFLASLLAVAALAEEGINYLITEDSEMLEWEAFESANEADYTNAGEELTLTTSDDGTDITFCFAPTDVAWTEEDYTLIVNGVAWTDGVEYVAADDTETDAVLVAGTYAESAWTWRIFDSLSEMIGGGDESTVWTESADTDFSCTDGEVCTGAICVQRALEAADGEFELPFKSETDFIAYYQFISFIGVAYSGAMSLGIALFSAAGAALTLI